LAVTIDPPPRTRFIAISWALPAITPDGKAVVFAARGPNGSQLYVRRLDEFEARPLPGTEDAVPSLTVSPDGKWIWFPTTGVEMKKVALSGAAGAVSLGTLPDWFWANAAQWSGDSLVYFVGPATVWAIGTNAASRRQVASLDTLHGERAFASAFPVPDARLLISVATDSGPRVALRELDGQRRWISGLVGTVQAFLPPDHVIVSQPDGRLTRSRLDLAAARVSGSPVAVASGAGANGLALSATGTSAYFRLQRGTGGRLVWVERNGRSSPTPAAPGEYRYLALSPDGQRASFYGGTASEQYATSVIDLRSGGKVTLPSLDYSGNAVWERSGRNLLFATGHLLPQKFMRQAADGAGKPAVAFTTPFRSGPDWQASDGSIIIEMLDSTSHLGAIDPAGRLRAEVKGPGTQRIAKLSPDGKWLAYMSNESGRFEIYVQPWPALDRKVAVSSEGGTEPAWGPDGTELFFRHGGTLMASKLVTGPTLQFSRPEPLFDTSRYATDPTGDPSYDVGPDGRFLMIEDDPETRIELRVETSALAPSRTRQ
jgi:Tol biopolymer transport system component